MENSSQFGGLYKMMEFELDLEIVNATKDIVSNFTLDIAYPVNATGFDVIEKIENNSKVISLGC
jgi:hypothetical protein